MLLLSVVGPPLCLTEIVVCFLWLLCDGPLSFSFIFIVTARFLHNLQRENDNDSEEKIWLWHLMEMFCVWPVL